MPEVRIVACSPEVESYVDIIAALVQQYRPDRIELAFPHGELTADAPERGRAQSAFVATLHQRLLDVGKEFQPYREAEGVEIVPRAFPQHDQSSLLQHASIVDVTAAPKKLSVELVAESLQRGHPRVCALHWLGRIERGRRFRVGHDPYQYVDLTALERTAALRRSYAARAQLLRGMGVAICTVASVAILARWYPRLAFANDVLLAVSVAAGFAGLYVAVRGDGAVRENGRTG